MKKSCRNAAGFRSEGCLEESSILRHISSFTYDELSRASK